MSGAVDYNLVGSSMEEVKGRVIRSYLYALETGRRPDSLMVWGQPGIGKTFTIYAAAREIAKLMNKEVKVKSLMLSTMDPTDIVGVPHRHREYDYTQYLPLKWAWDASVEYEEEERKTNPNFKAPPMVLFFDDFPVAHQQVQAACFKLFHEGQAGDLRIRDNVFLIAAGNRPEDNAAAQEMPTAMASRFRHIYAKVNADDWLKWASNEGDIHPLVVAYLRGHKSHLHSFDASAQEKAFPCPRTWEMISTAIKENDQELRDSVRGGKTKKSPLFKVTAGIIGTGEATQLHAFLDQTRNAVPAEEIVRNPKKAKVPVGEELDALHATIAELEHHVKNKIDDWKAALTYSVRDEMLPEMGVLLVTTIVDALVEGGDSDKIIEAIESPELSGFTDKYGDILAAVQQ